MHGSGNKGRIMKLKVQVMIEYEGDNRPIVEEICCLNRGELSPETLGLTLSESKGMLAEIQKKMVTHQAIEYVEQQGHCPNCGRKRYNKGKHEITYRSVFGKLHISSPRLYTCSCQPQKNRVSAP